MARTKAKKEEEELPFKITDHFLVPKHELLTPTSRGDLSLKVQRDAAPVPIHLFDRRRGKIYRGEGGRLHQDHEA